MALAARLRSLVPDEGGVRTLMARASGLLGAQLVAQGLAFVQTLIVAASLGVTDYGRFALISTSVVFIAQIIDARVWEAGTRFGTQFHVRGQDDEARAVLDLTLAINLLVGVLATLVVLAAGGLIAGELAQDDGLRETVWIYGLIAPYLAITVAATAALRVVGSFRALGIVTVVAQVMRLAGALTGLAVDGGIEGLVVGLVIAEATAAVLTSATALSAMRRTLKTSVGVFERIGLVRSERRRMLRFLGISNVHGSLRIANSQLDVLVLGALSTPAAAGTLKLATTFALPLGMIAKPFYETIYPALTAAYERGRMGEVRSLLRHSSRLMAAIAIPMGAFIAIAGPLLIPLVVGSEFDLTWTLVPLAAAWTLTTVFFWGHAAALALDMQLASLRALAISLSLQMGLLVVLAPALGAPGAALCYLFHAVVWTALIVPAVWRRASAGDAPPQPSPAGQSL